MFSESPAWKKGKGIPKELCVCQLSAPVAGKEVGKAWEEIWAFSCQEQLIQDARWHSSQCDGMWHDWQTKNSQENCCDSFRVVTFAHLPVLLLFSVKEEVNLKRIVIKKDRIFFPLFQNCKVPLCSIYQPDTFSLCFLKGWLYSKMKKKTGKVWFLDLKKFS